MWTINDSTKQSRNKFKKYMQINENEKMAQNIWDIAKAILRGKCVGIQTYLKKKE